MINPLLLQYIKKQLLKGTPKEVIVKNLLDNGWPEADIEDAFMLTPHPEEEKLPEKGRLWRKPVFWIFAFILTVFLVGAVFLAYSYVNNIWIFRYDDLPVTLTSGNTSNTTQESGDASAGQESDAVVSINISPEKDIFSPGDNVIIVVETEGSIYEPADQSIRELDTVTLVTPFGEGVKNFPPYEFQFQIPNNFIGEAEITALGDNKFLRALSNQDPELRESGLVKDKITIEIAVESQISGISFANGDSDLNLYLEDQGDENAGDRNLRINAVFDDGAVRNITTSPDNIYTISDENIISIDQYGKITPKSLGIATVKVENGGVESPLLRVYVR